MQQAFAQDPLAEKMSWYNLSKPHNNLFVHFDKNVYSNNEMIWFTGYLLKSNLKEADAHQIMSVALIRAIDSTVVLQKRYLMDKGIAMGSLQIPDFVLTGDYYLTAFTNMTIGGKPAAMFVQPITLKTNIDPPFKANIKLTDTTTKGNDPHQVLISVTTKDGLFLPKPTSISYRYGALYKNTKTDASGQLLISLPQQNQLSDPNIYVKLQYEKDSTFINMPLPQPKAKASVKFYPEGGNMVAGLPAKIGWEVKDQQNRPIPLKALLFKDNKVVDTLETSSYGIGKFQMVPESNHTYTVKLVHSGLADSVYTLPSAIAEGLVMDMANAVVQDTLKLTLGSNATRKFIIRVHNFRESFLYIPFDMGYSKRVIKIPLTEVPKGLAVVTISDSLNRPLAERMFFAHYDRTERIKLTTDQPSYKQREKVTLKLNLKNVEEQAIVSVACVQDNRLELKKMTDIESYTYLNQELGTLPLHVNGNGFTDREYMEQVLLVKGWRKYTWQELQQTLAKDTVQHLENLKISGQVTRYKKELGKAKVLGTIGGDQMAMINTEEKGIFYFQNDQLLTSSENKMFIFVNDKDKYPYDIKINDPYINLNKQVAKRLSNEIVISPTNLLNNSGLVINGNEKAIRLQQITITSKKDKSFNNLNPQEKKLPGSNACGDYVCVYNILNCRNHVNDFANTQPIPGTKYTTSNKSVVTYRECTIASPEEKQFLYPITGIYLHKEFYHDEYKEPQEPAFFSTIYWNYLTPLKAGKETELSFYTSDIKGKFRIVVQGTTNKGVVYAEQFFEVKAN
ncbi:hypothetical protein [Pedobacter sp. Hv1]|uniref:hypothetical protein n=1 Tax=Pedobacter sp. Hv1 TaxID=1740090 RepID=UPI0006D8BBBE|nr:hypothetical protein [Pedobacter sp. Hv1]KQC00404.1 hypothetical protein AQF98_13060 [Pedobacter sp. Hv1]